MNPFRSKAMIASAMSLVRPIGRRAGNRPPTSLRAATSEPVNAGGQLKLEPIEDRAATSYSLIGW
jgi:hypothetical protein